MKQGAHLPLNFALALVLVQAGTAESASAQPPAPSIAADKPEIVSFTISGGISLGAYKAGVNWFLVEAYKRLQPDTTPAYQDRLADLYPEVRPRPVAAAVMSGASAGNINAIISAITWCTSPPKRAGGDTGVRTADSAESSLFWRTWVTTGIEQLLPDALDRIEIADAALLQRSHFDDPIFVAVRAALRDERLRPGCEVPIGVTLTRIAPDTLLFGTLRTPVQRHAMVANMRVDSSSVASFHHAPRELLSERMGILIVPAASRAGAIDENEILRVAKASSAFPIAFAPVELAYYKYSDIASSAGFESEQNGYVPYLCPIRDGRCAPPERHMFMDGGAFDNLPISLGLDLARRYRSVAAESGMPVGQIGLFHVVPVDPASTNAAESGQSDLQASKPVPRAGLSATLALLAGGFPTARAYELQMFQREMRARDDQVQKSALVYQALMQPSCTEYGTTCDRKTIDAELGDRVLLSGSSRSFPLMGERMHAFGAFFGRPLREYDFYLGVLDGMIEFARGGVCLRLGEQEGPAQHAECTGRIVAGMLDEGWLARNLGLDLSERGWLVVRQAARAAGYLDSPGSTVAQRAALSPASRVLYELGDVRDSALAAPLREACVRRHPVDAILCDRDYIGLVEGLRTRLGGLVDEWREDQEGSQRGETIDEVFLEILDDPERFADGLYSDLLWRQDRIERWLGTRAPRGATDDSQRSASMEKLVALLEMAYHSGNDRYRQGYHLAPSSIPPRARKPLTQVTRLLPYYVAGTIGTDGVMTGWRPTLYLRRSAASFSNPGVRWGVLVPTVDLTEIKVTRAAGVVDEDWHLGLGGGLLMLLPGTALSGLEITSSLSVRTSDPGISDWQQHIGGEIAARFVGNKVRLSIRRQPQYLWKPSGAGRSILIGLGVSDVPGITYWTARLIRAH